MTTTIDQMIARLLFAGYVATKDDDGRLSVRVTENPDEPPVKVMLYTDSDGFEDIAVDSMVNGTGHTLDDLGQAVRNAYAERYELMLHRQYCLDNRPNFSED